MFMLKDSQGRAVLAKEKNRIDVEFYAKVGADLEPVDEATIFVGEDICPNPEHIEKDAVIKNSTGGKKL